MKKLPHTSDLTSDDLIRERETSEPGSKGRLDARNAEMNVTLLPRGA